MHKVLIFLPVILAGCMAAAPSYYDGYEVAPVARGSGWAGCEAAVGAFRFDG